MNNLENIDIQELISRYEHLIKIYVPLTAELAEKFNKFGKIRQELQVISAEFVKRNHIPDESPELKNVIETILKAQQSGSQ